MKSIIFFILIIFNTNLLSAAEFLTYLESAYKSNPVLNASRENYKAIKENINISRGEFLPSVSVSGNQSSKQNSNRTNQVGAALPDISNTSETQSFSIDQKACFSKLSMSGPLVGEEAGGWASTYLCV